MWAARVQAWAPGCMCEATKPHPRWFPVFKSSVPQVRAITVNKNGFSDLAFSSLGVQAVGGGGQVCKSLAAFQPLGGARLGPEGRGRQHGDLSSAPPLAEVGGGGVLALQVWLRNARCKDRLGGLVAQPQSPLCPGTAAKASGASTSEKCPGQGLLEMAWGWSPDALPPELTFGGRGPTSALPTPASSGSSLLPGHQDCSPLATLKGGGGRQRPLRPGLNPRSPPTPREQFSSCKQAQRPSAGPGPPHTFATGDMVRTL